LSPSNSKLTAVEKPPAIDPNRQRRNYQLSHPTRLRDTLTSSEGAEMEVEPHPSQPQPATEPVEARGARLRRLSHRTGLYAWAFVLVGLLVVVIALAIANTRQVKLSWIVGTSHASLVWVIVAAAVLGWLLGIVTGVVFRLRTRRRRASAPHP
jgi:uncharacterized integral membrane protein